MTTANQDTDFVKDEVGDVNEAPERPIFDEQTIPEDAPVGEPDYLNNEQKQAAKGFLQMLMQVLTPQPKGNGLRNPADTTPEYDFAEDADILRKLRDALRYVGSTSIKVVDTPSRFTKFVRQAVGDSPTRVAGYQPNRKRITIKNDGTNAVYLGDGADVSSDTGYILEVADNPIVIESQDEIWAVCASTESATLHIIGEHYD